MTSFQSLKSSRAPAEFRPEAFAVEDALNISTPRT
jgi:hypothetical protein